MYAKLKRVMGALKRDERGVSALEYVILAAVVVGAVVAGGAVLENVITNAFDDMGTKVTTELSK